MVRQVKTRLAAQGFVLEDSSAKSALFVLDRGLVTQGATAPIPVVHIWIELQLKFKEKGDDLRVMATEEVVGNRKSRLEFRKPADSDRPNVQKLLDAVRTDLEAASSDTAVKQRLHKALSTQMEPCVRPNQRMKLSCGLCANR